LKRGARGQVALEFMSLVGILALFLVGFTVVSFVRQNEIQNAQSFDSGVELCDVLLSEINDAGNAGDGYAREFYTPQLLAGLGQYYTVINSTARELSVVWNNHECVRSLQYGVSGTLAYGANSVRNSGGAVLVNQ
jgi:hypothetical protein